MGEGLDRAWDGEGEEGRGVEREIAKSGSIRDGAVRVERSVVVDVDGVRSSAWKSPNNTALPPCGSPALDASISAASPIPVGQTLRHGTRDRGRGVGVA